MHEPVAPSRVTRDAALLREIRAGSEVALSTLARLYATWLVEIASNVVGDIDLAQDVVQEVFVRLWDTRGKLRDEHVSVAALLYRSTRNRAMNMLAREKSQKRVAAELGEHAQDRLHADNAGALAIERVEFLDAFAKALATLPARTREIYLLRARHDLTPAEIAEALELAPGTVYTQLYRATQQLAKALQTWNG